MFLPLLFALLFSPLGANSARYLHFTAQDQNGIYLRNLKIDEVSLLIDDKPVEVAYLGYKNVGTAFAFIIENSPRTAPYAVSLPQWGQVNIVDQIRYFLMQGFFPPVLETGQVLLAEFYKRVKILQDFTNQDYLLEEALRTMQPNFAPVDKEHIPVGRALGRGVDLLKNRPEKRKILVLFATTIDRESYKNLDEYREMLRAADIELYVISFAVRFPSGPGYSFEEKMNRYFFRHLVDETSGKAYVSGEYVLITEFIDDLMARLSNSYTIGFYVQPEPESPRQHSVTIKARHDKIDLTHRKKIVF